MARRVADILTVIGLADSDPAFIDFRQEFNLQFDANDGRKLSFWENSTVGVSVACEERIVRSVMLFGNGKDDFAEYEGELPGGLDFRATRTEIRTLWGDPVAAGAAAGKQQLGFEHGGWDKYVWSGFSLHLTYSPKTGELELLTLEAPKPS